jgi:SAM-dependent methyltransferase
MAVRNHQANPAHAARLGPRARENARHYVVTGQDEWSDEEFYQSGQVTLEEEILNDLATSARADPKDMKVLEIGCGAGRVTRAFAEFFGEVYAVDISREMVRQARRAVAGCPTRTYSATTARIFPRCAALVEPLRPRPRLQLDFAFSYGVPAHPQPRDHRELRARGHRLLRPGALFKFQVQGSPLRRAGSRTIVGWACPSRSGMRAPWRNAAASSCDTSAARGNSITGSGSSRSGGWPSTFSSWLKLPGVPRGS